MYQQIKIIKKHLIVFVVRRDEAWRKIFYDYFEKIKFYKKITFEEILKYLYKKTGIIEASFSSKLPAVINPNMPIQDQYILNNLNLKVEGYTKEERLNNTIKVYDEIINIENKLLNKKDIKQAILSFKKEFKEYNLTDMKILDYFIWNNRLDINIGGIDE